MQWVQYKRKGSTDYKDKKHEEEQLSSITWSHDNQINDSR